LRNISVVFSIERTPASEKGLNQLGLIHAATIVEDGNRGVIANSICKYSNRRRASCY